MQQFILFFIVIFSICNAFADNAASDSQLMLDISESLSTTKRVTESSKSSSNRLLRSDGADKRQTTSKNEKQDAGVDAVSNTSSVASLKTTDEEADKRQTTSKNEKQDASADAASNTSSIVSLKTDKEAALLESLESDINLQQNAVADYKLKQIKWPFDGVFGKFDRAAIQRGYQIYREVCSSCHSLKYIAFRNLEEIGFSPAEVKSIASSYEILDGPDDDGDMFERPGLPSDYLPPPFANKQASMVANGGAYPPDLSLMIKAEEDGANLVYSILTGYMDPPEGFEVPEGMYYNLYHEEQVISMTPPLSDGLVDYQDGAESTVSQMAMDVVNFLAWAAEPKMEERKKMGVKVIIFLSIMTILLIVLKKNIWKELFHEKKDDEE